MPSSEEAYEGQAAVPHRLAADEGSIRAPEGDAFGPPQGTLHILRQLGMIVPFTLIASIGNGMVKPISSYLALNFFARNHTGLHPGDIHCELDVTSPYCQQALVDVQMLVTVMSLAMPVAQLITLPAVGVFSDAYGRRKALILVYTLSNLALLFSDLFVFFDAPLWFALAIAPFVNEQVITAVLSAACVDILDKPSRAAGIGMVQALDTIAYVCGLLLGLQMGMRASFLLATVGFVVSLLYLITLYPESLPPEKRSQLNFRSLMPWDSLPILWRNSVLQRLSLVMMLSAFIDVGTSRVLPFWLPQRMNWVSQDAYLSEFFLDFSIIIWFLLLFSSLVAQYGEVGALFIGRAACASEALPAVRIVISFDAQLQAGLKSRLVGEALPWGRHFLTNARGSIVSLHELAFGIQPALEEQGKMQAALGTVYAATCTLEVEQSDMWTVIRSNPFQRDRVALQPTPSIPWAASDAKLCLDGAWLQPLALRSDLSCPEACRQQASLKAFQEADTEGRGVVDRGRLQAMLVAMDAGNLSAEILMDVYVKAEITDGRAAPGDSAVDYKKFLSWLFDTEAVQQQSSDTGLANQKVICQYASQDEVAKPGSFKACRLKPEDLDFSALTKGRRMSLIPETELRGILPSQLQALVNFIAENRCLFWPEDGTEQKHVEPQHVDLHQVTSRIIKPLTSQDSCSYVEAIAGDKSLQRPAWFVSHWWGEAVADFNKCIQAHRPLRQLQAESAYWVCAYANNQHELNNDLVTDPMETSFLKAMQMSLGVLLILDAHATPFSRIWCCFEEGVVALGERGALHCSKEEYPAGQDNRRAALRNLVARDGRDGRPAALKLDVATVDVSGLAQLITSGLTEEERLEDFRLQSGVGASGWQKKSDREASFPIQLLRKALDIDLTAAKASYNQDKVRILNALAGRRPSLLDSAPDFANPRYHIVNTTLRGIFAVAAYRRALQEGLDTSDSSDLPLERALREDCSRRELELALSGVMREERLPALMQCIAAMTNLKLLSLDFSWCRGLAAMKGLGDVGHRLAQLCALEHVHIDLSGCAALTSISELMHGIAKLTALRYLSLRFSRCTRLASIAGIGQSFEKLTTLQKLHISFRNCASLTSVAELGEGLWHLTNLQHLHLSLGGTSGINDAEKLWRSFSHMARTLNHLHLDLSELKSSTDVAALGQSLTQLSACLRHLHLNCSGCEKLSGADKLRSILVLMVGLQHVHVNLNGCDSLNLKEGITEFEPSLARLIALQHLHLDLCACQGLQSVGQLGLGLASMADLTYLHLDLSYCHDLVSGAEELGQGLQCLSKSLQHLHLVLRECHGLKNIARLEQGLAALACLSYLHLDLSCSSLPSVAELGKRLMSLATLEHLHLSLRSCQCLASVAELGIGLACLASLQYLCLDLSRCKGLTSVSELLQKIGALAALRHLHLSFSSCENIDFMFGAKAELRDLSCLGQLTSLLHLHLDLSGCGGLRCVTELGQGLSAMVALQRLHLNLNACCSIMCVAELQLSMESLDSCDEMLVVLSGCLGLPVKLRKRISSRQSILSLES
ncbi:unnamed protein product [Polarella glacialis]|uniref:Uncharacterized protein n=1 Tax=Polarella glacialis TaxID=89957 RepID=A0A813H809_POLGL|nr:unnamed protein product [Polarella glacialis]